MHIIPSALGTAGERFFQGAPAPRPANSQTLPRPETATPAAAANPIFNVDSDTLSSGSGVAYSRGQSVKVQATAEMKQPLAWGPTLVGRASVFAGKSRYHLPVGAGALIDPTTIKFVTTGSEIEAGLIFRVHTPVQSNLEVGAGHTQTDTRTKINSALLDVSSPSSDRSSYIYTAIEIGVPIGTSGKSAIVLRTTGKFYPEHGGAVQSGLVYRF